MAKKVINPTPMVEFLTNDITPEELHDRLDGIIFRYLQCVCNDNENVYNRKLLAEDFHCLRELRDLCDKV